MGATAKWFLLMLGETNDSLLPVYNRALDVVGALRLAFIFSAIDDHIAKRSNMALTARGQLRTRAGVALQMLRSLPLGDYIFGTNERARYEVLNRQMTAEISELNLLPPLRERENPTPQAPNHLTLPPIMPGALDTAPEYPPSPHPSTATMRNPLLAQACDDADSLPSTNSV